MSPRGTGVRAKPILVIHVHCVRCDACLCVRETGSSEVLPSASIRHGTLSYRSEVVVGDGVCVESADLQCLEEDDDEAFSAEGSD